MGTAVEAQTDLINKKSDELKTQLYTIEQSYLYKAQMRNTMRIFNNFLLFFYAFFFILIHVMYGVQYWNGVKRNEIQDSIMLTVFFVYPYVIYSIEAYIFDFFAYIAKIVFGLSYIPALDVYLGNLSKFDMPPPSDLDSIIKQ